MPNAIVLIIDGLQAGFVGCYGNSWVDTPALNRLAAEGCCFDFAMADSVRIEALYRSYWSGAHRLAHETFRTDGAPLLRALAAAGVRQHLVSDAAELFPNELVEPFESHLLVPPTAATAPAATIDATHTAEFVTAAIEQLDQPGGSRLLWLHTQGLCGGWDAPWELREQLRDADDPPPRDAIEPPQWMLPADHDPDELLQIVQAYAAQVMLLDHGLGWLLEAIDQRTSADETLLIVAGARGFALGEHGWVGRADGPPPDDAVAVPQTRLHNELLHLPLLVRLPGARAAAVRNRSLVQPADLYATLVDWFKLPRDEAYEHPARGHSLLPLVLDDLAGGRPLAVAADRFAHTDAFAARTDIWQLVTAGEQRRLYVKPDDRWEVNDVADRANEVVEGLDKALRAFQANCQDPNAKAATPLAEELTVTQD